MGHPNPLCCKACRDGSYMISGCCWCSKCHVKRGKARRRADRRWHAKAGR